MDYDKFKNIVVDIRWSKSKPKSGDDYRSLRIQLDHFVERIVKADSPLKWLPLDDMSEEELAIIANKFLDQVSKNRLFFQGLNYHGIKYNYNELIIENPEREIELERILETFPELKNYKKLKIMDLIGEINIALLDASNKGYQKTAELFLNYIDTIKKEILQEKKLFFCIGLGFTNTGYIEQFISVCDRICFGTLYFFIIANKNVEDKIDALQKIEQKLHSAYETLLKCEAEAKNRCKEHRNVQYGAEIIMSQREGEEIEFHNNAEEIVLYYVQFLNRKAYYEELENIEELLKKEPFILKSQECFASNKVDGLNEFSEGRIIPSFDVKFEECKKIIEFARKRGNFWGSSSDAKSLKITLFEGYLSRVKYQRRTATAIIRNILAGEKPSIQELMFLDMKMLHGDFRENGMSTEYELFSRICEKVRKMYLLAYSAINDEEAYKFVHRTCFEFLYLFGDTNYSGLKLE